MQATISLLLETMPTAAPAASAGLRLPGFADALAKSSQTQSSPIQPSGASEAAQPQVSDAKNLLPATSKQNPVTPAPASTTYASALLPSDQNVTLAAVLARGSEFISNAGAEPSIAKSVLNLFSGTAPAAKSARKNSVGTNAITMNTNTIPVVTTTKPAAKTADLRTPISIPANLVPKTANLIEESLTAIALSGSLPPTGPVQAPVATLTSDKGHAIEPPNSSVIDLSPNPIPLSAFSPASPVHSMVSVPSQPEFASPGPALPPANVSQSDPSFSRALISNSTVKTLSAAKAGIVPQQSSPPSAANSKLTSTGQSEELRLPSVPRSSVGYNIATDTPLTSTTSTLDPFDTPAGNSIDKPQNTAPATTAASGSVFPSTAIEQIAAYQPETALPLAASSPLTASSPLASSPSSFPLSTSTFPAVAAAHIGRTASGRSSSSAPAPTIAQSAPSADEFLTSAVPSGASVPATNTLLFSEDPNLSSTPSISPGQQAAMKTETPAGHRFTTSGISDPPDSPVPEPAAVAASHASAEVLATKTTEPALPSTGFVNSSEPPTAANSRNRAPANSAVTDNNSSGGDNNFNSTVDNSTPIPGTDAAFLAPNKYSSNPEGQPPAGTAFPVLPPGQKSASGTRPNTVASAPTPNSTIANDAAPTSTASPATTLAGPATTPTLPPNPPAPESPDKANSFTELPPAHQMLDSAPVALTNDAVPSSSPAHLAPDPAALQMHVGVHTSAFGNVEVHTIVEQSQVGISIHGEHELAHWFNSELGGLETGLKDQHLHLTGVDFSSTRSGVQTATSFQHGQPRQNFSHTPSSAAVPAAEPPTTESAAESDLVGTAPPVGPESRVSILV